MLMFKIVVYIMQVYRRYISGSPRAHVTLSGDVIGPIFPGDEPVSLGNMFPSGNGRSVYPQVDAVTYICLSDKVLQLSVF